MQKLQKYKKKHTHKYTIT